MRATLQVFCSQAAKPPSRAVFRYHHHRSKPLQPSNESFTTSSHNPATSKWSKLYQQSRQTTRFVSSAQKARDLNQQGIDDQVSKFDDALAEEKEKEVRAPWHREGADVPPVHRQRSAGAMTKGSRALVNQLNGLTSARQITHHSRKTSEACLTPNHGGSQFRYCPGVVVPFANPELTRVFFWQTEKTLLHWPSLFTHSNPFPTWKD